MMQVAVKVRLLIGIQVRNNTKIQRNSRGNRIHGRIQICSNYWQIKSRYRQQFVKEQVREAKHLYDHIAAA